MRQRTTSFYRGDAIAILVIVAAVLVIGVVGFIAWRNLSKSESAADISLGETGDQSVVEKTVTIGEPFATKLSVTYPKTWKYEVETAGPVPAGSGSERTEETVRITSPSGKIQVRYYLENMGGLGGGPCIPEDNGVITKVMYTELAGMPNVGMGEYETSDGEILPPLLQVTDIPAIDEDTPLTDVRPGLSTCELQYRWHISVNNEGNNMTHPNITARVELPNYQYDASGKLIGDADEIRNLLASNEGKVAKDILLSTRLK